VAAHLCGWWQRVSLVAGIDYSTHAIDVVLIDEDTLKPEWSRYDLSFGTDAFDRARHVRPQMGAQRWWDDVLAIGIEEPRGYNAGALYRIQGAVLSAIPLHKLVQPWVPSEWRKAVGLKGNASKLEIMNHVIQERLSQCTDAVLSDWPQDACDAWCIARATLQALERTTAA
jgi:hypothetical protein